MCRWASQFRKVHGGVQEVPYGLGRACRGVQVMLHGSETVYACCLGHKRCIRGAAWTWEGQEGCAGCAKAVL